MKIRNIAGHFYTITKHKWIVMGLCFRVGLYRQGLAHDLSKYSPAEFFVGCRYYQGDRSPNQMERLDKGCSTAWLHHKGRNKHHYEYWIDYDLRDNMTLCGMKMPYKYVVEMFLDRVAACKVYRKDKYKTNDPYDYYIAGEGHYVIHEESQKELKELLIMLKDCGEEKTLLYIKERLHA